MRSSRVSSSVREVTADSQMLVSCRISSASSCRNRVRSAACTNRCMKKSEFDEHVDSDRGVVPTTSTKPKEKSIINMYASQIFGWHEWKISQKIDITKYRANQGLHLRPLWNLLPVRFSFLVVGRHEPKCHEQSMLQINEDGVNKLHESNLSWIWLDHRRFQPDGSRNDEN